MAIRCARVSVSDASHADAMTERVLPRLYCQAFDRARRLRRANLDDACGVARGTRREEPVAAPAPAGVCGCTRRTLMGGRPRPSTRIRTYFALQSLPTTRTELTRRCWLAEPDIEPEAEPVADPVDPVAEPVEPVLAEPVRAEPDALVSSVPVTSTRLPTSDDRSDELPSSV